MHQRGPLVGGVSADASGLRFLSGRIEGVISTHRHVIELAREVDLLTIHRLFAIDSGAVERGVKLIRRVPPGSRPATRSCGALLDACLWAL